MRNIKGDIDIPIELWATPEDKLKYLEDQVIFGASMAKLTPDGWVRIPPDEWTKSTTGEGDE